MLKIHFTIYFHYLLIITKMSWKFHRLESSYDDIINVVKYFLPMETKHCNTNRSIVWTARETMLKNKPHLVTFDESILVSLRIFQAIIIYINWKVHVIISTVNNFFYQWDASTATSMDDVCGLQRRLCWKIKLI